VSAHLEELARGLERTVRDASDVLARVSEQDSELRPAPGKWSRKEIIGHLIDSAANNHARFVRARERDDLDFEGYDQDAWERAQEYQREPWQQLLVLWKTYNLHVAHVMRCVPRAELERPRARHSLDRIAWKLVPADRPATLEYLMRDYVGHLEHHVRHALER
jgi:hypothetical protein